SERSHPYMWDRIADEMQLPMPNDPDVIAFRDWYIKHPKYLRTVTERAAPFLHLITEEIDKRQMPMELVLLPIVESAYNPNARSHGNAVGLWQFLSASGRRYGLKQDYWYDGRRDVVASTQAALDYLAQLNAYFEGDWLNAVAAYNAGEGRIQNAIEANRSRGKATDFFSLNLPRQTMEYVPRLMALADVIKNAKKYGIDLPKIPNRPSVRLIDTNGQIDLRTAAEQANMSLPALKRLNPGFNRNATSPQGPNHLLVPINVADELELALADMSPQKRMRSDSERVAVASNNENDSAAGGRTTKTTSVIAVHHKVKRGDTLWTIASSYGVSEKQLMQWNKLSKKKLKAGQVLLVNAPTKKASGKASKLSVAKAAKSKRYEVRRGDSLSSIAEKFQIKVNDLVRWNGLDHNRLKPGQTLTVRLDDNGV
ncbi:MAG: LysM peptidoglycan-binding domain-containing protein, partial [Gammaproteobacteria bacterium]|nr:LysM peptidoglycan-binding domain-containing protein [Gammaproteobacteria bacterium]